MSATDVTAWASSVLTEFNFRGDVCPLLLSWVLVPFLCWLLKQSWPVRILSVIPHVVVWTAFYFFYHEPKAGHRQALASWFAVNTSPVLYQRWFLELYPPARDRLASLHFHPRVRVHGPFEVAAEWAVHWGSFLVMCVAGAFHGILNLIDFLPPLVGGNHASFFYLIAFGTVAATLFYSTFDAVLILFIWSYCRLALTLYMNLSGLTYRSSVTEDVDFTAMFVIFGLLKVCYIPIYVMQVSTGFESSTVVEFQFGYPDDLPSYRLTKTLFAILDLFARHIDLATIVLSVVFNVALYRRHMTFTVSITVLGLVWLYIRTGGRVVPSFPSFACTAGMLLILASLIMSQEPTDYLSTVRNDHIINGLGLFLFCSRMFFKGAFICITDFVDCDSPNDGKALVASAALMILVVNGHLIAFRLLLWIVIIIVLADLAWSLGSPLISCGLGLIALKWPYACDLVFSVLYLNFSLYLARYQRLLYTWFRVNSLISLPVLDAVRTMTRLKMDLLQMSVSSCSFSLLLDMAGHFIDREAPAIIPMEQFIPARHATDTWAIKDPVIPLQPAMKFPRAPVPDENADVSLDFFYDCFRQSLLDLYHTIFGGYLRQSLLALYNTISTPAAQALEALIPA